MLTYRLKFVVEDVDRHGNVRVYLRRTGLKKVRLFETPGTDAFMHEYQAALLKADPIQSMQGAPAAQPGSFRRLCQSYYGSPEFLHLDVSTRKWRRRALDLICEKHGNKPFVRMDAKGVLMLRNELSEKPGAANSRLKALKAMFAWAFEAHEAAANPTRDVHLIRYSSAGHRAWTAEDVAAFEAYYPIGTKARLAMALLLYTDCRREDVVRFGPQNFRNGRIRYTQAKNEHRKPVPIDMPVPLALQGVLDSTEVKHLTFLVTAYGRPFTANGFGNRFRDWCRAAGLPNCPPHGLRKTLQAVLADNGASTFEIQAISGHQSLEETERYTRTASQRKLADSAIAKLDRAHIANKSVPLKVGV